MTRTVIIVGCLSLLLQISATSAPHQAARRPYLWFTNVPKPTPEQVILNILGELEAATLKKDINVFRQFIADDYSGVNDRGTSLTRNDVLASLEKDTFSKYVLDSIRIRVDGNTAIVTGRATYTGTVEGVSYTDRQMLFTDTFISRNGLWQIKASQSTAVTSQQN